MFQGGKEIERKNYNTGSYHPRDLSFILLTHAHIDHSGLIPNLVREGFRGKVVCTKATLDLCEVLFRDSGHIQEMEAEWQNRKDRRSGKKGTAPLYTVKDAEKSLPLFSPVKFNKISSLNSGLKVRFQDAGHILGSAIIELWVEEGGEVKKLVFSGDLGNSGQPNAAVAYQQAIDVLRQIGNEAELGKALLAFGRYKAESGKVGASRDMLRDAITLFSKLGLTRPAEDVEKLLASLR